MNVQDPQSMVGGAVSTKPPPDVVPVSGGEIDTTSQETNREKPIEFEYEFSFVYEGRPMFVGVWDTNDRSACERVVGHPVKESDITYSDTGNGFVTDKHGFHWAFHKEVYERSWPHGEIGVHPNELSEGFSRRAVLAPNKKQPMSADAILAGL